MASLTVKLLKRYNPQVRRVHAPTSSFSNQGVEDFYVLINRQLSEHNHHFKIVMSVFNTKAKEKQQGETVI